MNDETLRRGRELTKTMVAGEESYDAETVRALVSEIEYWRRAFEQGQPPPAMRLAMYRQGIAASGGMTVDEIESRAHRMLAAELAPEARR